MKILAFAALAALVFIASPSQSMAQVDQAHARAWDRHERGGRAVTRKVRHSRVARQGRSIRKLARKPIPRRYSPAIASKIQIGDVEVPTPLGVPIRLVGTLVGVPNEIKSFLSAVQSQCGPLKVISGLRPGARVAGSGVVSCHAMGQAADYTIANPACALKVAAGYRNLGHSTDYSRVAHFHVSNCRRESGARFAHYAGRKYTRYAKAKKRVRYAMAIRRR